MDQAALAALSNQSIYDEMEARRRQIRELQAERLELHEELTRREQAKQAAELKPNAAKDQVVRGE